MVVSNEPLMSCRPLPDWSKDKPCIYALDTFDDNFVFGDVWSYTKDLNIYKKSVIHKKSGARKKL